MPIRPARLLRAAALAGTALLAGVGGVARAGLLGGGPKESIGPFELTPHESSHWVGVWETKVKTVTWSIRFRGEAVRIGGETRFNTVVSFPTATPALLVNAGYPYDKSRYHLLRDEGGKLRIEDVGPVQVPGDGGNWAPVEWLDDQPTQEWTNGPILGRLPMSGGRYLIAGLYAILDTQTLAIHRLPMPPEHPYTQKIVARSPDGRSFVRMSHGGEPPVAGYLVVQEFAAGHSYALPVDSHRMRYTSFNDISKPEWIAHHFEWKTKAGTAARLVERASFKPLPFRGEFGSGPGGEDYSIEDVGAEFGQRFIRFLEQRYKGRRVKATDPEAARPDGGPPVEYWYYVAIGDTTLAIQSVDERFAVWRLRGPDEGLVRKVCEAFEKEVNR